MFNEGWNIISYLNRYPASVEDMMESIEQDLIIIKDEDGLIYWPQFGVNSMNNMYPGRGYQIKLNTDLLFSYPPVSSARFSGSANNLETKYFSNPKKTGENMTIGIPVSSWTFAPSLGDEIAVFSSNGLLIGSQIFDGHPMAISIWGDDFSTFEPDGVNSGESLYFKFWDHNLNQEKFLKVDNWIAGSDIYHPNSINIIGSISIVSDQFFQKEITRKFDLMGKSITILQENQIGFFLYQDGSVKKQVKLDY